MIYEGYVPPFLCKMSLDQSTSMRELDGLSLILWSHVVAVSEHVAAVTTATYRCSCLNVNSKLFLCKSSDLFYLYRLMYFSRSIQNVLQHNTMLKNILGRLSWQLVYIQRTDISHKRIRMLI